ncbi:MAG: leucine-rich repeat protein [Lachnospiraceae bacterium]|nr:leucine-rich repeat protein [Lachnospiraceae bacterium]
MGITNNSSVTSTHSKSSSGGGGSSTSSSTTDNTIVRGKGTDKAAYIKTGKGTVKYVKPIAKKKAIKITVPDTIKINGKSYKVTSIEKNAFENCKKLPSVTIGKNVKRIGKEAFSGCKKLEKMTVISLHLTKKSVKDSLKNSYISIVVVPKKKKAAYSKIFSKKNTASRYPIIVKKMK